MSKHLTELCTLLVDGLYGELSSRIISTLLLHGRLTILPLCQLSDLNPRYVKNGLATLVQGRLVRHVTSDDGVTVYEADTRNAYEIVRFGKAAQLVAQRFGPQAAELVLILQDLGFATANEILEFQSDLAIVELSTQGNQSLKGHTLTNGISKIARGPVHKSTLLETRLQACRQLFASKYIINLTNDDFLSVTEYNDLVEATVRDEEFKGVVKGTKETKKFRKAVLKRKRQHIDSNTADPEVLEDAAKEIKDAQAIRGQRRRAASVELDEDHIDMERSNKRRKIDKEKEQRVNSKTNDIKGVKKGAVESGSQALGVPMADHSPAFRINRDKFDVSTRSQYLIDLSARFFGETTSKVYGALLRRLERHIPRCHDEYAELKKLEVDDEEGDEIAYDGDEEKATATSMEAEQDLDPSVDVQSMFTTDKPAKVNIEIKENGNAPVDDEDEVQVNGIKDHISTHETKASRQKRVGFVEQHLRLLAEHSFKFLTRVSTRGQGTWTVDFDAVSHSLIQLEIDNLVTSRFGATATRIVRILHSKGKLDEKQIGSIGLIRQKDLRRVLTLMQEAGFVDTQEVPRDNTRQPSRTIYLWFYDQERCRKLVLNDTYKCMSRLLQRAKVEKEKVQAVIDKAERTDVKGQEDKYLSTAEKDALAKWRSTEQKLLVQLSRQDDLVAIFRDFLPLA